MVSWLRYGFDVVGSFNSGGGCWLITMVARDLGFLLGHLVFGFGASPLVYFAFVFKHLNAMGLNCS